jgi:Lon protease-like protein
MEEILLPLFPLELVLLPEEPLPLHIFRMRAFGFSAARTGAACGRMETVER